MDSGPGHDPGTPIDPQHRPEARGRSEAVERGPAAVTRTLPPPPLPAATALPPPPAPAPGVQPKLQPSLPPSRPYAASSPVLAPVVLPPVVLAPVSEARTAPQRPKPVAPVLTRRRRRRPSLPARALFVAVLGTAGWVTWQGLGPSSPEIPVFDGALPTPTSYWVSFGEGLGVALGDLDADDPVRWRAQRAPGSEAIVVEFEAGFGPLDGETMLMTPDGAWFFDRLTGATSPTDDVYGRLQHVFDRSSEILVFDGLVTDDLRRHIELTEQQAVPAPQAGAEGDLTRYVFDIDRLGFAENDRSGFIRWATTIGIFDTDDDADGPDPDGADLDPSDLGGTDPRLDVVVDEAGVVWSWQLRINDAVALEYRLLELSDTPFIPPTPVPVPAPAPEPTSAGMEATP